MLRTSGSRECADVEAAGGVRAGQSVRILCAAFSSGLRLLHPFAPYITEYLFGALAAAGAMGPLLANTSGRIWLSGRAHSSSSAAPAAATHTSPDASTHHPLLLLAYQPFPSPLEVFSIFFLKILSLPFRTHCAYSLTDAFHV